MRPICCALLVSILLLIGGCGGSGTSVQSGSTAKLAFAIEWPAPSRFIHQSATHIVVSAKVNNIPIVLEGTPNEDDGDPHTMKIVRPDPSQSINTSQVSMTGLPSGPLTFTVESFRAGEATALGKATVPVVLVPGNNPNLEFVLESQTATVEVVLVPQSDIYEAGQTLVYSARSMQNDKIVIQGGGEYKFTSSNPTIVQLLEDGTARLIASGSSVITARELGNDSSGRSGQRQVNVNELPTSTWAIQETDISASTISDDWTQLNAFAYASVFSQILRVDQSGNVTLHNVTGLTNLGFGTFQIIGVGPSEQLYVKYNLGEGRFHIYRIQPDFHAVLVSDGFVDNNQFIVSVNRDGTFGARVERGGGTYDFEVGQPGALRSANILGQPQIGADFFLFDNGGAIVREVAFVNTYPCEYVRQFGTDSSGIVIAPPSGYSRVRVDTASQEGFWKGIATNGDNLGPTVFGRFGSVVYTRSSLSGYGDPRVSSTGMIAHVVWSGNDRIAYDLVDIQSASVSRVLVPGHAFDDYTIRFVLSPNVMIGSKGLNFAILKRLE